MKRFISLCAFSIAMAFPLVSSASSVTNTFLTSSTGTTEIGISDTIQFEVTITADSGVQYDTIFWSLTGDALGAIGSSQGTGWVGVANIVTNWEWNYTPAGMGSILNTVDMGTNGKIAPFAENFPPPDRVTGVYGFFGQVKTGDGIPSLVGTVTLHADTLGSFEGGGYQKPGIDGFLLAGVGELNFGGGAFTVVPEPGTALLMGAGLAGLTLAGRRRKNR